MGLQVSDLVRVYWIEKGPALDQGGSEWAKVFEYEDLPELVTIPEKTRPSEVKPYIEGRYGFKVSHWSYWSAIAEASRLAENLYSSDPL